MDEKYWAALGDLANALLSVYLWWGYSPVLPPMMRFPL
jgi:hypothetical protein